jgi:hypothetical protein
MQTITKQFGILLVLGLLTLAAGNVSAQSLKAQFDEDGNGSSGGNALAFTYPALEPMSGFTTLMYTLPWPVTRGDLILTETNGTVTDLIRFDNILNTTGTLDGVAYFFSDGYGDETPIPMADSPFGIPPPNAAIPTVTMLEQGPEGNNGVFYVTSGGSPGSALQGGNTLTVAYTIISDSPVVPEPSTFVLLGMSGFGLAAYAWRKRRSAQMLNDS